MQLAIYKIEKTGLVALRKFIIYNVVSSCYHGHDPYSGHYQGCIDLY